MPEVQRTLYMACNPETLDAAPVVIRHRHTSNERGDERVRAELVLPTRSRHIAHPILDGITEATNHASRDPDDLLIAENFSVGLIHSIDAKDHDKLARGHPVQGRLLFDRPVAATLNDAVSALAGWISRRTDHISDLALTTEPHKCAILTLRQAATGLIHHDDEGGCPDDVEGPDARDPACPVCMALTILDESQSHLVVNQR